MIDTQEGIRITDLAVGEPMLPPFEYLSFDPKKDITADDWANIDRWTSIVAQGMRNGQGIDEVFIRNLALLDPQRIRRQITEDAWAGAESRIKSNKKKGGGAQMSEYNKEGALALIDRDKALAISQRLGRIDLTQEGMQDVLARAIDSGNISRAFSYGSLLKLLYPDADVTALLGGLTREAAEVARSYSESMSAEADIVEGFGAAQLTAIFLTQVNISVPGMIGKIGVSKDDFRLLDDYLRRRLEAGRGNTDMADFVFTAAHLSILSAKAVINTPDGLHFTYPDTTTQPVAQVPTVRNF